MINILLADDHAIVRRGLRQIFAGTPDMVVTAEAGNTDELMAELHQKSFDIIVLDITMPGQSGLDILPLLKISFPGLPILILSMHPEEEFAVESIRKGASGYVTKESAPEELLSAVRKVVEGHKYVSSSLAEKLAGKLEYEPEKPMHEYLSKREFQVMTFIAEGKTPSEIATALNLSVKTISTYRANILKKMKFRSNADLTRYAVQNKIL